MNKLLVGLIFCTLPVFGAPKVVLKAVGQVANQVVTSRDVQVSTALEQVLYPDKKSKQKIRIPELSESSFRKDVITVLLEVVIEKESKGFTVADLKDGELQKAFNVANGRLKKLPHWVQLQVQPKELKEAVRQKLRAKRFIRFKAESSVVPVTDSEAKKYFEENRLKFGDLPFESFKENIKSFLGRQQVDKRLRDWFEVLQSKHNVKNFLSEI